MKRLILLVLLLVIIQVLFAERVLVAAKCDDRPPKVDGVLDDICWESAQVVDDFTQKEPDENLPSTERTEVRVVFSSKDVYIGVKAFDSSPKGPTGYLARRDSSFASDWISIWLDSLGDKRTAFEFQVNPAGVKRDVYWSDEERGDENWDAIWDVAVRISPGYWIAEFKIPLSQLRFPKKANQEWGFQVERLIIRRRERSYWSPVPKSTSRFVSLFGKLVIADTLTSSRNVQVFPYLMAKQSYARKDEIDPFSRASSTMARTGVDLKYPISSNFSLDATVNPDFGQVEADPSYINLTAYEIYLQEKRPFFVEGANIYRFSIGGGSLFYSRRIGRSPRGIPDDAAYVDVPDNTPITLAFKLTGKSEKGWSVGILDAITPNVSGNYQDTLGEMESFSAEPLTNYSLIRVQKDFRQGRSAIGAIVTSVSRGSESANLDFLNRNAFAGGIDFRHRWKNDNYEVAGAFVMSRISGTTEAIQSAQESSARYFQRPDNKHVTYDPTRTALEGYSFKFYLSKIDGSHWRWEIGGSGVSPGFEVNDMGYLPEADSLNSYLWLGYHEFKPTWIFREFEVSANYWNNFDFAPERLGWGMSFNTYATFLNYWFFWTDVSRNSESLSWSTLRGGPSVYMPGSWNLYSSLSTDSRKVITLRFNLGWRKGDEEYNRTSLSGSIVSRIWNNLTLEFGPTYNFGDNPLQYIAEVDNRASHYVFGSIQQKTFSLTLRVNLAVTPELTMQLYSQPFVSAGKYSDFKEVQNPLDKVYANRWYQFGSDEIFRTDAGFEARKRGSADILSFADPDFNFQQFRLNFVLRWEFRPGSTVYLVWTQGRDNSLTTGQFSLPSDLQNLFRVYPTNVFLVKFTYWFNV